MKRNQGFLPGSRTKTRRILLVDDEPDVPVTIETVLEESGFFLINP
jgi:hypothetical protein